MKNGTQNKQNHEIGDLVMKKLSSRKYTRYILGVVREHRIKYNGRSTAYPWGIYWVNQDTITRNGNTYHTSGEVTRYKNNLKEYLEK